MDYLDVIVHVFTPDARDYYRLEQLWGEAPRRAVAVLSGAEGARTPDLWLPASALPAELQPHGGAAVYRAANLRAP